MPRLTKIYTRSGDQGETGLGDGTRVAKDAARIGACGSIDELNSHIGWLKACPEAEMFSQLLERIQHELFDLGAELCMPGAHPGDFLMPGVEAMIEDEIDRLNEQLGELDNFILPGGTQAAAVCHVARCVCRRAERDLVTLSRQENIPEHLIVYVNRLSDLLFVLARALNDWGKSDVLWNVGISKGE
jgi:cob(I)alamin adenosyltransferase